ncbi:MAG: hypothetical protein Q8K63_12410, partial [Acidimicrobiales bacterium]|nr:hypothetical protein [Acidimicrobiales bacterium]
MNRRLQRVLLACVVSNAAFGSAGLALLDRSTPPGVVVASAKPTTTIAAGPTSTVVVPTAGAISAQAAPATSEPKPSSTRRSATKTTTPASAAAGDVTGITSSTAPSAPARVAPTLGSYAVDIAGTASVGGRSQSVPTSGSVIFANAGNNIRQSSPKAPGDVVLLQHFSGAKSELVTLELTAGDNHKVFSPSAPVTYLLYNAPSGTSWNWSADSTDGKTHVAATGRVGGTKDMTIGGVSVRAVEVVHELVISGD